MFLTKPTCFECKAGTEIRGATNAVKSKVTIVGKSWKVRMILQCWQLLRLYSINSGWIQWVRIIGWIIMTGKEQSTYRKTHRIATLSSEKTATQCTKMNTIFFCK